jgi:hypothetical protein
MGTSGRTRRRDAGEAPEGARDAGGVAADDWERSVRGRSAAAKHKVRKKKAVFSPPRALSWAVARKVG